MDIERLFNQKQRFSTPIVFSVASIVEGTLKLVFKTTVECVRLTTFGKHGFQQIQVRRRLGLFCLRRLFVCTCVMRCSATQWCSACMLLCPAGVNVRSTEFSVCTFYCHCGRVCDRLMRRCFKVRCPVSWRAPRVWRSC